MDWAVCLVRLVLHAVEVSRSDTKVLALLHFLVILPFVKLFRLSSVTAKYTPTEFPGPVYASALTDTVMSNLISLLFNFTSRRASPSCFTENVVILFHNSAYRASRQNKKPRDQQIEWEDMVWAYWGR